MATISIDRIIHAAPLGASAREGRPAPAALPFPARLARWANDYAAYKLQADARLNGYLRL